MEARRRPRVAAALAALSVAAATACAGAATSASRYRLTSSGDYWDKSGGDRIYADLDRVYPEYFAVILDPATTREPDLRPLRRDLEKRSVDRRNYDALNALAIGYYELNYRAGAAPGGPTYFGDSIRAAALVAIPWRAYGEVDDGALRDAILDFFEDAGTGGKLGTRATAPRLARIVASLERKEADPARADRIRRLAETLSALGERPPGD